MQRQILIIDDDKKSIESACEFIKFGKYPNHKIVIAHNGKDGLKLLAEHYKDIDVIILDRAMPVMSGTEFMVKFKENNKFKNIPVIMQSSSTDKTHLQEGFKLGVYHYLIKPYSPTVLNSIIKSAIEFYARQRELLSEIRDSKTLFQYIERASFKIKNLEEADLIGVSLAALFPNPDKVILGISEMLTNAIEHGNLGLTYEDKKSLKMQSKWYEEVKRRLENPENAKKVVRVSYIKRNNEIILNIKDEGQGFDYKKYLNHDFTQDEDDDNNGRGIAFANKLSFDSLEYVGCGNEVNCTVKLHQ